MNILERIIQHKRIEVAEAKRNISIDELKDKSLFDRTCYSLRESVLDLDRNGIIAEYKRASPSKGSINAHSDVSEIAKAYEESGVSAISVLTDSEFFKGSLDDLIAVREAVQIPVLRKEFIVDPFQITEAKAYGADVILLIAACLSSKEIEEFSTYAKNIGLNVLLEIHNEEELKDNKFDTIDAIGVNNRNLTDFSVSLQHSLDLVSLIPVQYIKVSESGISNPDTIKLLKNEGFQAFLIGENFMKMDDPAKAIQDFVKQI
ncbi:indole-3-glycerol phosphate synthase TrpC [Albibacterium sp.]|uniref:indole-3-glycerol phosphate synthase TrpC n=1 Tax=Albibacterium sp. TaxID=2952885 RepID=UPI002C59E6A7|nr:indole-3-glycerol phosphate synthase TrpC [Albibacterium sp.]HUH19989.1 indole-3-glycerol phosphate synthase TrpC [Albibacterium sp.]